MSTVVKGSRTTTGLVAAVSVPMAAVVAVVAAVVALGGAAGAAAPATAATGISAQPVRTGLAFPAAFTSAPDGRIFYAEKETGRIAFFTPGRTGGPTTYFTVTGVSGRGDAGLLGLALDPHFPATPAVYAYATRTVGSQRMNQILRITGTASRGSAASVIYSQPAGRKHHGGPLRFGSDGLLYVVVGEGGNPANAQDLHTPLGKVLRMTTAGKVPPGGNPGPGLVYAYGIRNSFGLNFDPATGSLWETDNGPTCNDELNRIAPGANYGWGPSAVCTTPPAPPRNTNRDGPDPVLPLLWYTPEIVPTGLAFCSSCGLGPANEGRLFFGAYTGDLRRVTLDASRTGVVTQAVVLHHAGGILSVERGPGGALYFSDPTGIFRLV